VQTNIVGPLCPPVCTANSGSINSTIKITMQRSTLFIAQIISVFLVFFMPMASASDNLKGAYTLPSGEVVVISSYSGNLRFFMQNGRTGSLDKIAEGSYSGTEPAQPSEPAAHTLQLRESVLTLHWEGADHLLSRIPLTVNNYHFASGELALRGRLTYLSDKNYRGVVILVQGSERDGAIDNSYFQYLFAANGLATFVYDKRGTGGSDGRYTQDFQVLADDLNAAINFVAEIPGMTTEPLILAGFSQGGWIAPLASAKSDKVGALLLAYGPAVSLYEEDRWGYAYWLQREGYPAEDIAKADRLFAVLTDMRSRGTPDRWSELEPLIDQYEDEKWYTEGISDTDSSLANLTDTPLPLTLMYWWSSLFGLDRFEDYDPAATLAQLNIPSHWLYAAEDSSMPTLGSVKKLTQLAEAGKPVTYKIYPDTMHGIVLFDQGPGRERHFISYHPDYFTDMIEWLKGEAVRQAGAPGNGQDSGHSRK